MCMEPTNLIILADRLSDHIGRSDATISNWVAGHALLFRRLRQGKGCTWRTAQKAGQWFSDNWPEDLEWPDHIPRPKKSKKEAA